MHQVISVLVAWDYAFSDETFAGAFEDFIYFVIEKRSRRRVGFSPPLFSPLEPGEVNTTSDWIRFAAKRALNPRGREHGVLRTCCGS
jgi:hypothetical protein